jgi:hypothetical protein
MGRGEVHTWFWWRDLGERNRLKDLGVDGRIILKGSSRREMGGMDWFDLSQDRDRCRALVNAVINLPVP